jgi:Tfp pilus assembly protein FimT
MKCHTERRHRKPTIHRPATLARGFSVIELVLVLLVAMVLAGMAIPTVTNALTRYRQQTAVVTATGAIQATRYRAIFSGCPYKLAFSLHAATKTYQYQVSTELPNPPTVPPTCAAAYANVGNAVDLGAQGAQMAATVTLQFNPDGSVSAAPAGLQNNMVVSYQGLSKNIGVSNYGSVKTCDGTAPCP